MSTIVSSYNPTTAGAVDTRATDQLQWSFTARPQAMTVYVRFQERGTVLLPGTGRIIQIGDTADSAPRFILYATGGFYRAHFQPSAAITRTSVLATAPAAGQMVELMATLTAAGVVQLAQSVQGGAVTSATAGAAALLPPAWSGTIFMVGGNASGGNDGCTAFLNVLIVRGVQDFPTMRRLAGVGAR